MAHTQAPLEAREGVEVDLMRRTQSFVRRDREYKTKIELLEAELSKVHPLQQYMSARTTILYLLPFVG
jgi:hypothetical protein